LCLTFIISGYIDYLNILCGQRHYLAVSVDVTGIGPSEHKMCEYYVYIHTQKKK